MKAIGICHREAIDWTQDLLGTTRPIAERTLFALLREGKVALRGNDLVLLETEDEVRRMSQKVGMTALRTHPGKGACKWRRKSRTVLTDLNDVPDMPNGPNNGP